MCCMESKRKFSKHIKTHPRIFHHNSRIVMTQILLPFFSFAFSSVFSTHTHTHISHLIEILLLVYRYVPALPWIHRSIVRLFAGTLDTELEEDVHVDHQHLDLQWPDILPMSRKRPPEGLRISEHSATGARYKYNAHIGTTCMERVSRSGENILNKYRINMIFPWISNRVNFRLTPYGIKSAEHN